MIGYLPKQRKELSSYCNVCGLFFLGFLFVPSKFVRPPAEFRSLYGPNIRQTVLESYFVVKKRKEQSKIRVSRIAKHKRQKKITEFFKL